MRDYPSMPNVFRVASSQSINNMGNGSKDNPFNNSMVMSINRFSKKQQEMHQLEIPKLSSLAPLTDQTHPSQLQQQQQNQHTGVINTVSGSIPATGFASSMAGSFNDLRLNNLQYHNNKGNKCNSKANESATRQQQHKRNDVTPEQSGVRTVVGSPDVHSGWSGLAYSSRGYLWLLTPVAASISVAIVIAALAGPQWLFTEEKLANSNYNGTTNFDVLDDGAYITKYTKSSLWILCTTLPGLDLDTYNCIKIDYFPKEGYQPDPNDSTPAIIYTVTKSCPIFLAAGILLLVSFIVFLIPTCSNQNNLYYFAAGILFIVSGLVMLIGLVAYISILKSEIGSKLRPRSNLQPALFKVTYGQSFFLFVFGFIATEFVGVLNIFLYINLQEVSYYSRLPCFSVANIQVKINEGRHPLTQSYKRYKQPGTTGSNHERLMLTVNHHSRINDQTAQHAPLLPQISRPSSLRNGSNARLHQIHDVNSGRFNQTQTLPGAYSCRKHSTDKANFGAANFNLYTHNDLERHFYFGKPAVSKCNLHSRSFAKSLNELCTEPISPPEAFSVAPPPPTFADQPQEFPLTRSVSTTTDISTAAGGDSHTAKVQRKTTNTLHEDQSRLCGLKRGLRKSKDELFQELCHQAGVRSKNIYHIRDEKSDGKIYPKNNHIKNPDASFVNGNGIRVNDLGLNVEHDHDDDNGFNKFQIGNSVTTMDEDQLYVVGDHIEMVMPRRCSMVNDPKLQPVLRKLHSNLSLHSTQAAESTVPKLRFTPATELGNSCSLPRCFLRRSAAGSQSSLGSLQSSYSSSQQRFSQIMLANQSQLHQQNQYLSTLTLPQAGEVDESHQAVCSVQWPVAIPSSPSNMANGYRHPQHPHPLYPGTSLSSTRSNNSKFQRAYAFDDTQQRTSFASSADAFDLDEIERERRRSHASLFGLSQNLVRGDYDPFNGTAV